MTLTVCTTYLHYTNEDRYIRLLDRENVLLIDQIQIYPTENIGRLLKAFKEKMVARASI